MKCSYGEQKIIDILKKATIPFEREKQFKDCRSGFLKYDFFLPELNILIEFNGEQHYKYNRFFFKNKSEWTKAQERDRQKIAYALARGYKIYCIPYWEFNNLNNFDDLFSEEFVAKTKFHNDIVYRRKFDK